MLRTYKRKIGRTLYENTRWRACGARKPRLTAKKPLTLGKTVKWARRLPRSAVAAQGFTRIIDFARHVKKVRAKRADLRTQHPDPTRRAILDALDRVLLDRRDLLIAACRESGFWWEPPVNVWWGHGKPRAYDGVRIERGNYYPRRNVAVPALWLLARLDNGVGSIAARLREADPRPRILSTPHWIDRVAAEALTCPPIALTPPEWAQVEARREVIWGIRRKRRALTGRELLLGDFRIGRSSIRHDYEVSQKSLPQSCRSEASGRQHLAQVLPTHSVGAAGAGTARC
jgi:hypothetical protein